MRMKAIHSAEPRAARFPLDWELIWVILSVAGIVLLEILLVLFCVRVLDVRSKANWRRLRQNGSVVVDGPTLIWAHDLPPQPTYSTFNLRQIPHMSCETV